jgi:predicted metal-binding protein
MNITLCHSCALGRAGFADTLRAALKGAGIPAKVQTVDCMSGCIRPSTLAARSAGKTAYLFGDLTEADLPDILAFARLYLVSPDGNFADARPLGALRLKAIARIPGEIAAGVGNLPDLPLSTLTAGPPPPKRKEQGVPSDAKHRD